MNKIKIGISPIAWLNDDMPKLTSHVSVHQCLTDVKNIGFQGIENCGAFPKNFRKIKNLFSKYNLNFSGGWYSGSLLIHTPMQEYCKMKKILKIFEYMKTKNIAFCECTKSIQSKSIGLNFKPYLNRTENFFFQRINELSRIVHDNHGVNISYHHHMGTVIQNECEIDLLMNSTSDSLKLLLDTGHLIYANIDPVNIFKKYKKRISHIHFKDIRQKILKICHKNDYSFKKSFLSGVFTVPGDGDYDFRPLIRLIRNNNYNGWIIVEAEQDPIKYDPFYYSLIGFNYLNSLIGSNYQKNIVNLKAKM